MVCTDSNLLSKVQDNSHFWLVLNITGRIGAKRISRSDAELYFIVCLSDPYFKNSKANSMYVINWIVILILHPLHEGHISSFDGNERKSRGMESSNTGDIIRTVG